MYTKLALAALVSTFVLVPAAEALELCARADWKGTDPTAPKNNSPIKLRTACKPVKEVSLGTTEDLAEIQANKAAIEAESARVDYLEEFHGTYCSAAGDWEENGDGTATQCSTGLIWEMKTGVPSWQATCTDHFVCPDPHDVNNSYTWSGFSGFTSFEFDGTAATVFLDQLNTPPCFGGSCTWRLPTIVELVGSTVQGSNGGIFDHGVGDCGGGTGACSSIPGETAVIDAYWTASPDLILPESAWQAAFNGDYKVTVLKISNRFVRAVRDPS